MSEQNRRALRIVIAGHVDHGKSTMIGRLLHETGSLPEGKIRELEDASRKRGVPMEWSFVLDALQAERDQAVTIDTTRVWFNWNGRRYAIIDAPGHREFVRNMISGASEADAAVLVVDVGEGVSEQTRRHAHLLRMLGIDQVIVVVNKLDAVGYDQAAFDALADLCRAMLASLKITATEVIPISARDGENLVKASGRTPWYRGPVLIQALEQLEPRRPYSDGPLRMRVQDVYRHEVSRVAVGRVDSGSVRKGDKILISPIGAHATVRSIERWNAPPNDSARAGESVGLIFEEPIFVSRGDIISHPDTAPSLDFGFHATCFWLGQTPPVIGEYLAVQFGPTLVRAAVAGIEDAVDSSTLAQLSVDAVEQYSIIELRLRCNSLVPLDTHAVLPPTSRLVISRGRDVVAGGFVSAVLASSRQANITSAKHLVTVEERARRNGHRGAVIWMTGLPGAGKSTLAMALERRLFTAGSSVFVLDGDNVRSGLNSDLGFSAADRAENLRRIAEVATLLADAGMIVITAFISPTERDRAVARQTAGTRFHEVFVDADLATCEARDPKGLYRRARAGEIADFTGVSAPYEKPLAAEVVLDTANRSAEHCLEQLLHYIDRVTGLKEAQLTHSS